MSSTVNSEENIPKTFGPLNKKYRFNMRRLRISLKFRPDILKLVLKMRQSIRKKNVILKKLKQQLKCMEVKCKTVDADRCKQDAVGKPDLNISNNELYAEKFKNKNNEQDSFKEIEMNTRSSTTQTDNLFEKKYIDNSTSHEIIVKDCYSQTKINSASLIEELNVKTSDILHISDQTQGSTTRACEEKTSDNNIHETEIKITYNTDAGVHNTDVFTQTESTLTDDVGTKTIDTTHTNENKISTTDSYTQTENPETVKGEIVEKDESKNKEEKVLGWTNPEKGEEEKSIAEQVKEVAQNAMQQSGMVYVESAGMYYDYKTGYYYNSELGLYYHTDTGCYYYYSEDQKNFVFHSYPDRSLATNVVPEKPIRKPKKHKKATKSDDIENLTKNFSQDEDDAAASKSKRKRSKKEKHKKVKRVKVSETNEKEVETTNNNIDKEESDEQKADINIVASDEDNKEIKETSEPEPEAKPELEDGECSESDDNDNKSSDDSMDGSDVSTSTASDDESVAKHHPPCMRVVVRETNLPKLKVGSLFLVTKDGGTIGREGEHHAILLKDFNVSRNHLDIKFDTDKRIYTAVDLGSKNGTILNGVRMSDSQEVSQPMEVVHGSTIQLGETKLLCHIHAGNDTCGHCEPGLIMEAEDKDKKVAYTRTCSVQVQHQLELARLKNKYAPKQLEIEETAYNDRAQARREAVGSSHHAEKTQRSDLDTSISTDNKGFKLLEKMGWSKGEGLGKEKQGNTEPVPLVSNEGTTGLGATSVPSATPTSKLGPATMRLAAKTKMLRPPAKAFQDLDDDDSE